MSSTDNVTLRQERQLKLGADVGKSCRGVSGAAQRATMRCRPDSGFVANRGPDSAHHSRSRSRAPRPGHEWRDRMIPGEMFIKDGDIELNAGRKTVTLTVANTGDRPIQVGSHYHFFETNPALKFDRKKARGMRLDIPAGTAVRFEPGQTREVDAGRATSRRQSGTTSSRLPRASRRWASSAKTGSRDELAGKHCQIDAAPMPTCSARPPATGCGSPTPISSSRSRRTSPSTARR